MNNDIVTHTVSNSMRNRTKPHSNLKLRLNGKRHFTLQLYFFDLSSSDPIAIVVLYTVTVITVQYTKVRKTTPHRTRLPSTVVLSACQERQETNLHGTLHTPSTVGPSPVHCPNLVAIPPSTPRESTMYVPLASQLTHSALGTVLGAPAPHARRSTLLQPGPRHVGSH